MKKNFVLKLARVLRVLVVLVFLCNILAMFFVPAMAAVTPEGVARSVLRDLSYLLGGGAPEDHWPFAVFFGLSWVGVWSEWYTALLTLFLWVCGACTAVILRQGKRVLDSILREKPFSEENGASLRRAAVCCFVISAAALIRTVVTLILAPGPAAIVSYNFLFIPIFFMGGLLFLVMSALFCQAAEMKAEQDLTI